MSEKLALFGGPKTIPHKFPPYNTHSFGKEESDAVKAVMESGVLSQFFGSWDDGFLGGKQVQNFERNWEKAFHVKHAVSVNSATSALIAAVGAIGIEPGDEVIVSPWTMCASATSIIFWNAIPVFADIEPETFNLDPKSIEKNITPRTKAIMVPDIYGHGANLDEIMSIAKRHGLKVIEDASQAPGAIYHGKFVGTIADIGVFSLNYHKHIHTGEGGVCVTNNSQYAEKMQLIRNHAEAVVAQKPTEDFTNMIGYNFRMGEIEAAIGNEQLKKLKQLAGERSRAGNRLSDGLRNLPGVKTPTVKENCTHVYYVYPLVLDLHALGVSRAKIADALTAEGVPQPAQGYQNVHLLPMYQKKIAYGKRGFPWSSDIYKGNVSYAKGICPVAESLHDNNLIGMGLCEHRFDDKEVDQILAAFHKVWNNLDQLRK